MFKNMNTLEAGGTGFGGVNLINRLSSLGANDRATIHRKDPVILDERIEYVRCDLTKMEDCRKVVSDMDYVFLCAANTSGAAVIQSTPLVHVTPNIVMNAQMLEVDGSTDAKIEFNPSKPSMIPVRLIDTTKAETTLGFKVKIGLRERIRKTIEWYRKTHQSEPYVEKIEMRKGLL